VRGEATRRVVVGGHVCIGGFAERIEGSVLDGDPLGHCRIKLCARERGLFRETCAVFTELEGGLLNLLFRIEGGIVELH